MTFSVQKQSLSDTAGIVAGYRSGLEDVVAAQIKARGFVVEYETLVLEYLKPARLSKYHPDFALPNGIIVETKGRFLVEDRQKHLLIKAQHPERDVRFVFSNSKTRIRKGSPTRYCDWCDKHGFKYADKLIPGSWFNEPNVSIPR